MATLEEEITALKEEIAEYRVQLRDATTEEEKTELRPLLTERGKTLNILLQQLQPQAQAGGGQGTLPVVSMKQRIFQHNRVVGGFNVILAEELTYKIAVTRSDYVDQFPNVFELGICEYGVGIDSLLDHILVGNVGRSEMVTVSRNADFLKVFDICCGFTVLRDQVDPSSAVRLRPDDTIVSNDAVMLKNEAKGDVGEAKTARQELTSKLDKSALLVFPEESQSIIGMTTFPDRICLYSIDYDLSQRHFTSSHLKSYDMRHLRERVSFAQDIFKIAQWMSTVRGPQSPFHLVPNVRTQTPNGHHITWRNGGICKELKFRSTRACAAEMEAVLSRIKVVYDAHLDNVEWGKVAEPNFVNVSRVGFKLRRAINNRMITKEAAIANIEKGMKDLHCLGFAHTDIKVDNVFVENGVAFLDDLEYLREVGGAPRPDCGGLTKDVATAGEQDEAQLQLLVADLHRN